jgi:hypothetical protein
VQKQILALSYIFGEQYMLNGALARSFWHLAAASGIIDTGTGVPKLNHYRYMDGILIILCFRPEIARVKPAMMALLR